MNKVVFIGPYIGDFNIEIKYFRPYVKWINDNIPQNNLYVASHLNRRFLYDFIDDDKYIVIYENLSREEFKQKGIINDIINNKEYILILVKKYKDYLCDKNGCYKKDILTYDFPYIKTEPNISIFNRSYDQIPYKKDNNKNVIVFIPDISENEHKNRLILNFLEQNYKNDFVVIGDKKTNLIPHNILLKRVDYFECVYKYIFEYISNAKLVICPNSHWTMLANQQKTFVFSWGNNCSLYKTNGIYGFGNKNITVDIGKNFKKNIESMLKYVISMIDNNK